MNASLSPSESPSPHQHIDALNIGEILSIINEEDAKIHLVVRKALPQIELLTGVIVDKMRQGGRLFYIGAGTSGRLGVLDASELPSTFGVDEHLVSGIIAGGDAALRQSVEHAEDDSHAAWKILQNQGCTSGDCVIGIAASGTTPFVVGGVTEARTHGIFTGCVTSNPNSPLSKMVHVAIEVVTGPEVISGSTRMKAGTAQKMVLNMISTTLMIKLGRVKGNQMVNMQLKNNKLIQRAIRILNFELGMEVDEATRYLAQYGSVQKVLDAVGNKKTDPEDRL
jgi:N-acetylmuramic acid 6-phosphate etherase